MTVLLALVTVVAGGTWIPLAQAVTGSSQQARVFYATLGNLVVAALALLIGGGAVSFGWKDFWLPVAGGLVWVGGNYTAFKASQAIGLARANGTWAPINIIVSFIWGALLFGELDHTSAWRFGVLAVSLVLVIAGVLLIVGSQEPQPVAAPAVAVAVEPPVPEAGLPMAGGPGSVPPVPPDGRLSRFSPNSYGKGLLLAGAAGCLWGSYFIPSQWAGVASQVGNFPLALGIAAGGALLVLSSRQPARLRPRATAAQLLAGGIFGVFDLALLGLVSRVGTGVGFTLAQLSLLVNASIGIYVFKVPAPGSRSARRAIAGILLAGAGGVAVGALK
jgi:glucose uptake protein